VVLGHSAAANYTNTKFVCQFSSSLITRLEQIMRSLQGDSYQGSRIVASGGLAEWLFRVEIAHRGQRFIGEAGLENT